MVARNRKIVRFVGLFFVLFLVLQWLYLSTREQTRPLLTHSLNAVVSAAIINTVSPSEDVSAEDGSLVKPGVILEIYKGCEGVEVMIILVAGLLAYPLRLRAKAMGILMGLTLVYLCNLVRIISLYYILTRWPDVFDVAHLAFWQSALILVASGFFLFWVRYSTRRRGEEVRIP